MAKRTMGGASALVCLVLQFHGLNDTALLPGMLNDTWKWLEVTKTTVRWLAK